MIPEKAPSLGRGRRGRSASSSFWSRRRPDRAGRAGGSSSSSADLDFAMGSSGRNCQNDGDPGCGKAVLGACGLIGRPLSLQGQGTTRASGVRAQMSFSPEETAACGRLVAWALEEDLGSAGDLTSEAVIPPRLEARTIFVAR